VETVLGVHNRNGAFNIAIKEGGKKMSRYRYLILSGTIMGIILFIFFYIKMAVLTDMVPAMLAAVYFVSVTYAFIFGAFVVYQLFFMRKPL
jgi:hypothetical protein